MYAGALYKWYFGTGFLPEIGCSWLANAIGKPVASGGLRVVGMGAGEGRNRLVFEPEQGVCWEFSTGFL